MVHKPKAAIRLTFAFEGDEVRLVDRTPVQKRIPPSVDEAPEDSMSAELRTANNAVTYRRLVNAVESPDVEVFDPTRRRGVFRERAAQASGAFTVLVPDDGAATDVVLLRPSPTRRGRRGARPGSAEGRATERAGGPVEIGRFSLR